MPSNLPAASPIRWKFATSPAAPFPCTCPDFRTAGLGTCKHIEATLIWLKRRRKGDCRLAEFGDWPFIDMARAWRKHQTRPVTVINLIADLRAFAAKKDKVAKLLIEADLPKEAEPYQKAAEKALAEVEAITLSS